MILLDHPHDYDDETHLCTICGERDRDLKHVVCPQCQHQFTLTWNEYAGEPETLRIRDCPSGGIYDVRIACPHCNYEEEL